MNLTERFEDELIQYMRRIKRSKPSCMYMWKYRSVLLLTSTNWSIKKVCLKICLRTRQRVATSTVGGTLFEYICVPRSTNHIECPSIPIKSHASRGLLFCRPNDRVFPRIVKCFISRLPIYCIKKNTISLSRGIFR